MNAATGRRSKAPAGVPVSSCPPWCVRGHGEHEGEEDWVHTSELLSIADGVDAHGCMSVDPGTGAVEGPFVMVDWRQYTPEQAEALARSLSDMARRGGGLSPPAGP